MFRFDPKYFVWLEIVWQSKLFYIYLFDTKNSLFLMSRLILKQYVGSSVFNKFLMIRKYWDLNSHSRFIISVENYASTPFTFCNTPKIPLSWRNSKVLRKNLRMRKENALLFIQHPQCVQSMLFFISTGKSFVICLIVSVRAPDVWVPQTSLLFYSIPTHTRKNFQRKLRAAQPKALFSELILSLMRFRWKMSCNYWNGFWLHSIKNVDLILVLVNVYQDGNLATHSFILNLCALIKPWNEVCMRKQFLDISSWVNCRLKTWSSRNSKFDS